MKTIHLQLHQKGIKYPRINLTKKVKIYTENYKNVIEIN